MRSFLCALAALAAAVSTAPVSAQGMLPVTLEGRGGLAFATGDFGRQVGTGYGLGANATFNLTPQLGVYGGYTFISFDPDETLATDQAFELQGFDAGARLSLPAVALTPYLRGGVVYYKGEFADSPFSAERKLGFRVGAGVDYPLGPVLSVTPEVSYVQIPGEGAGDPDASFAKLDVGLRFRL